MVGQIQRDIDNRHISVEQHILGNLNFSFGEVGDKIDAGFFFKDFTQIVRAHVGVLAHLIQRNVLMAVPVNIIQDILNIILPVSLLSMR